MRLDTSYYYWPSSWVNDVPGLFTGSGMPMRFTDRNGNLIDVYQATTQVTDESGQTYPDTIDTLLDNATGATGYYGTFVVQAHDDQSSYPGTAPSVVSSAQAHGVPIVSAAAVVDLARRAQLLILRIADLEYEYAELHHCGRDRRQESAGHVAHQLSRGKLDIYYVERIASEFYNSDD